MGTRWRSRSTQDAKFLEGHRCQREHIVCSLADDDVVGAGGQINVGCISCSPFLEKEGQPRGAGEGTVLILVWRCCAWDLFYVHSF